MRLGWEEYFMKIAFLVSERSTCLRRKVGAVAVKDRRIIATGYNGQIAGAPHCQVCLREKLQVPSGKREELCLAIHAEMNLIIQCAVHGVSISDAEIFCTTKPCITCFKALANCKVRAIYYVEDYDSDYFDQVLAKSNFVNVQGKKFKYLVRQSYEGESRK